MNTLRNSPTPPDHLAVIEDHVFVDLVTDHQNIVVNTQLGDVGDFWSGEYFPQGVVGVVVDDGFRLGGKFTFQLLHVQFPVSRGYDALCLGLETYPLKSLILTLKCFPTGLREMKTGVPPASFTIGS